MSETIDPVRVTAVTDVIRQRRTIGAFRPDAVPVEHVNTALELARWAPNHRKTEPWLVVNMGPETKRSIVALQADLIAAKSGAEAGETRRKQWNQIPGWLAVFCRISEDPMLMEEDYAACCCAIQNICLSLCSAGIGTKWSTGDITRHPRYFEILEVDPQEYKHVGLLWYGYAQAVPPATRTKTVDEFVKTMP